MKSRSDYVRDVGGVTQNESKKVRDMTMLQRSRPLHVRIYVTLCMPVRCFGSVAHSNKYFGPNAGMYDLNDGSMVAWQESFLNSLSAISCELLPRCSSINNALKSPNEYSLSFANSRMYTNKTYNSYSVAFTLKNMHRYIMVVK